MPSHHTNKTALQIRFDAGLKTVDCMWIERQHVWEQGLCAAGLARLPCCSRLPSRRLPASWKRTALALLAGHPAPLVSQQIPPNTGLEVAPCTFLPRIGLEDRLHLSDKA